MPEDFSYAFSLQLKLPKSVCGKSWNPKARLPSMSSSQTIGLGTMHYSLKPQCTLVRLHIDIALVL